MALLWLDHHTDEVESCLMAVNPYAIETIARRSDMDRAAAAEPLEDGSLYDDPPGDATQTMVYLVSGNFRIDLREPLEEVVDRVNRAMAGEVEPYPEKLRDLERNDQVMESLLSDMLPSFEEIEN